MASSLAEQQLARIGDCYEHAVTAIEDDDFDRVTELMADVDDLLRQFPTTALSGGELQQHDRAMVAYGRLSDALAGLRVDTRAALSRTRRGQKVLSAYGGRLDANGLRLEREG